MKDYIQIDTESILKLASQLNSKNQDMYDDFLEVNYAVNDLQNYWKGKTAYQTITIFSKIEKLEKSRYKTIKKYCDVLVHTVSEGSETTESNNIKLADLFL